MLCGGQQGEALGSTKWLLYLKEGQLSPDNLRILSWFLTQVPVPWAMTVWNRFCGETERNK